MAGRDLTPSDSTLSFPFDQTVVPIAHAYGHWSLAAMYYTAECRYGKHQRFRTRTKDKLIFPNQSLQIPSPHPPIMEGARCTARWCPVGIVFITRLTLSPVFLENLRSRVRDRVTPRMVAHAWRINLQRSAFPIFSIISETFRRVHAGLTPINLNISVRDTHASTISPYRPLRRYLFLRILSPQID